LIILLPLSFPFIFALSKQSVPLFGCVQSDDHDHIKKFPRERKEKERKVENQNQKKKDDPSKMKALWIASKTTDHRQKDTSYSWRREPCEALEPWPKTLTEG